MPPVLQPEQIFHRMRQRQYQRILDNPPEATLAELRKSCRRSQASVAASLGVGQLSVSRLEARSDTKVGTLRAYVEALGGRLHLVARLPNRAVRLTFPLLLLLGIATQAYASELRTETKSVSRPAGGTALRVEAVVRWKNAWHNARNHDAAWLVVKMRGSPAGRWWHGKLRSITGTGCSVSVDKIGAFCAPASGHRGDVTLPLVLEVEPGRLREGDIAAGTVEAVVVGIEMVYIPGGPFTMGDSDSAAEVNFSFRKLRIESEAPVTLQYKPSQYTGDGLGPVPAEFPKGTRAFYVMKYEVLQGQYATFLNMIAEYATSFRSPMGGREYYEQRGSIRLEQGRYAAAAPDRPANFMSWDDGTAFADWAGLRPWTEFEFSKAARGPVDPVANDYPWGTASKDRLLRRNQTNDELLQAGDALESRLTDATRDVLGASYFWVMDLAGSVWEKVVTVGHPKGRAFLGTHGDGEITEYGLATNADWPLGDHEAGGYGYRGGGYYARGMAETALNPHSRVEQRPYGSWGGGPRGVAYGFRAARSDGQ